MVPEEASVRQPNVNCNCVRLGLTIAEQNVRERNLPWTAAQPEFTLPEQARPCDNEEQEVREDDGYPSQDCDWIEHLKSVRSR